jgi:hypothetical protein
VEEELGAGAGAALSSRFFASLLINLCDKNCNNCIGLNDPARNQSFGGASENDWLQKLVSPRSNLNAGKEKSEM